MRLPTPRGVGQTADMPRAARLVLTLFPTLDGQSPVQAPVGSWAAALLMASAASTTGAPLVLEVRAPDEPGPPNDEQPSSDVRSLHLSADGAAGMFAAPETAPERAAPARSRT